MRSLKSSDIFLRCGKGLRTGLGLCLSKGEKNKKESAGLLFIFIMICQAIKSSTFPPASIKHNQDPSNQKISSDLKDIKVNSNT